VLSGSDRQDEIDAAYAAGANAYLSQPLDFSQLRRAIVALHDFWQIASLPDLP
jgi:DNA-binding NarL/FixJ family response regulator